jgi:stage II sporulation protein D
MIGKYARYFLALIITAFLLFLPQQLYADLKPLDQVMVRVGLSDTTTVASFKVEAGEYQLIDESTGIVIAKPPIGSSWTIIKAASGVLLEKDGIAEGIAYHGPIMLEPIDFDSLNLFTYSTQRYRDGLRIINRPSDLLVVNELDLEKYLYGVVGAEMGNYAEAEALKAQAVASRSYALSLIDYAKDVDVTIGTNSQVYGGYDAEISPGGQRSVEAVKATAGEVLYYNNILVEAYFHANAGGYTSSSETVWNLPMPYLKATPSPFDSYALNFPTQTRGWPANTYNWEKHFTKHEIDQAINDWNNRSSSGKQLDIDSVEDLRVASVSSVDGRVTELAIIGETNSSSVYKDDIRSLLDLRSVKFEIETDSSIYIKSDDNQIMQINNLGQLEVITSGKVILPFASNIDYLVGKNLFYQRIIPRLFTSFVICGQGHGHGVGMSQWGAQGMAVQGFNYKEIIEHYYNQGKHDGNLKILKNY